jgi:hypothetical protein
MRRRRRRRKRFIQLMFCDELYYAATVFDCCNTFATNGNTEYLRVCDEIYERFIVFESCNTW